MKFWNYIGEFLLFRWLFCSHKHTEAKRDVPNATVNPVDSNSLDDLDSYMRYGNNLSEKSYSRYDHHDYGYSQSYDGFHDEQNDYDMMDDDF